MAYLNPNIEMELTKQGFYEPKLVDSDNSKYINFEKIIQLNEYINNSAIIDSLAKEKFSKIPNIHFDKALGYYSNLYIGYVKEGNYREDASSGGFGTWILKELLRQKLIDGVIHVKESDKKDILFDYQISRSINEVKNGAKTKYYPVELSEVLELVKKTQDGMQ